MKLEDIPALTKGQLFILNHKDYWEYVYVKEIYDDRVIFRAKDKTDWMVGGEELNGINIDKKEIFIPIYKNNQPVRAKLGFFGYKCEPAN